MQHLGRSLALLLFQILVTAAPGLAALQILHLHTDALQFFALPVVLVIIRTGLRLVRRPNVGDSIRRLFAFAAALNVLGVIIALEFSRRSGMEFKLAWVLESWRASAATVWHSLGPIGVLEIFVVATAILAFGAFAYDRMLFAIERHLERQRLEPKLTLPLALILVACAGLYVRATLRHVRDQIEVRQALAALGSRAQDDGPPGTSASVVVLHLESVNAHAMFEDDPDSPEGFRHRAPVPGLMDVWRRGGGVLFPYFWSNTFATNRGIESLMCGTAGHLGLEYIPDVTALQSRRCLPQQLKRAGYLTPFFYSYFDLSFYDFAKFLPQIGFDQIHFGPPFMRDDDRKFKWGYDDCTFYDRLGDEFARSAELRTKPFFAYVEVSMHHAPYADEPKYPGAWPVAAPASLRERYVNSLSEQDHCLPRFREAVRRLERDDVHVFLVGDHSVPILDHFDLEDRFMTTLLYLPPSRAAGSPRAIFTHAPPSQSDLYATVMDLLYGKPSPFSFRQALEGGDYDPGARCEVVANQYGHIAFVRANERAAFSLETHEAELQTSSDRGRTWTSRPLDLDFGAFQSQYACPF